MLTSNSPSRLSTARLSAAMSQILDTAQRSRQSHTLTECCELFAASLQQVLPYTRLRIVLELAQPADPWQFQIPILTADAPQLPFLKEWLQHGTPFQWPLADGVAPVANAAELSTLQPFALGCALLDAQTSPCGCLLLEHQSQPYQADDLHLLQLFAQSLNQAVLRIQQVEQVQASKPGQPASFEGQLEPQRRADAIQQVLFEIASFARNQMPRQELYQQLHRAIGRLFMARNFVIALYIADSAEISIEYFQDQYDEKPGQTQFPIGRGMTSFVIQSRQAQLIDPKRLQQLIQTGEIQQALGNTDNLCSWMGAPMIIQDTIYGVVIVQSYQADIVYSEDDLALLNYLASHIAVSLERNAHETMLLKQQQLLAQQNQQLQHTIHSLKQAQAELARQEKLAAIGQMAAGVAHQLNTPLGFMHCNLELTGQFLTDLSQHCLPSATGLLQELQEMQAETLQGATTIAKIVAELKLYTDQSGDECQAYSLALAIEHLSHLLLPEQWARLEVAATVAQHQLLVAPRLCDQLLLTLIQQCLNRWPDAVHCCLDANPTSDALLHLQFRCNQIAASTDLSSWLHTEFVDARPNGFNLTLAQHIAAQLGGNLHPYVINQQCHGFLLALPLA